MIVWIPFWLCDPPHRVMYFNFYNSLVNSFKLNGYSKGYPAVIGYFLDKRVQLITGSHRYAAAAKAEIKLPVQLVDLEWLHKIYGTDEWLALVNNPEIVK